MSVHHCELNQFRLNTLIGQYMDPSTDSLVNDLQSLLPVLTKSHPGQATRNLSNEDLKYANTLRSLKDRTNCDIERAVRSYRPEIANQVRDDAHDVLDKCVANFDVPEDYAVTFKFHSYFRTALDRRAIDLCRKSRNTRPSHFIEPLDAMELHDYRAEKRIAVDEIENKWPNETTRSSVMLFQRQTSDRVLGNPVYMESLGQPFRSSLVEYLEQWNEDELPLNFLEHSNPEFDPSVLATVWQQVTECLDDLPWSESLHDDLLVAAIRRVVSRNPASINIAMIRQRRSRGNLFLRSVVPKEKRPLFFLMD